MNEKDLENLCSVKEEDFNKIFDDFFTVRNVNQKELEKKLDKTKIYNNYEIKKIEIKKGLTYEDFIDELLKKLNSYYYDGNKNNDKDEIDFKLAIEDLNQYTPKLGMLLEDFEESKIGNKKGIYFIEKKGKKITLKNNLPKEEKEKLINFIKSQRKINIEDINKNKRYIVYGKNNKFYFPTSKNILGYLHGDIGEFILFFLVEGYLKKPVLFSKVQHSKSSSGDKVKGSDGIHISYENGKPKFIFLESKFRNDFKSCLNDTLESQKEFLENKGEGDLNNEIKILYKEKGTIDSLKFYNELFESGFEKFINPYRRNEKDIKELPFELVSGIIYELGKSYEYQEKETLKRIKQLLEGYKSIENLLDKRKVTIFLFPLLNDEKLIKIFLQKIKI